MIKPFFSQILRVAGQTFKNLATRDQVIQRLEALPKWLETGAGLLIQGTFCTGKTAFATMLLREAMSFSATAYFQRAIELNKPVEWDIREQHWAKADLLVLDDLGAENKTTWAAHLIEYIIRLRYEDRKPTLVTTNYAAGLLKKAYPPVIISLLKRATTQVVLEGEML